MTPVRGHAVTTLYTPFPDFLLIHTFFFVFPRLKVYNTID